MIYPGAKRDAKEIELAKESGEWWKSSQRQHEYSHASGEQRRARTQPREVLQIVTTGLAAHQRDNAERADQGEGVDSSVEQGCAKSFAAARNYSEQGVTGVSNSGVGEQPAQVGLDQSDQIANENRERSQHGEDRRPTGNHGVPVRAAVDRAKSNEHNFSKDDERRNL